MILEFMAGEHPAARSLGAWMDAHPGVAGLVLLSFVMLGGLLEAV